MDLSWCIICDRHCTDNNNLYCSEACKFQDNTEGHSDNTSFYNKPSPPTSPTLYSFQPSHDRLRSTTTNVQPPFVYSYSSTLSGSSLYDT